jgi:NADPH:quinone reductase
MATASWVALLCARYLNDISAHGGTDVLTITDLADPEPAEGEVLIRIKAFGLNHAELYFRSGKWGDLDVAPATGIECAGTVELDRTGALAPGTAVVAIMGGRDERATGRTRRK